jgi:transposase
MNKTNLIAIDVAKNVFQLCELDDRMKVHRNEQVRRDRLKQTLAKRSPCIVAMEACYSSHYWAREFTAMGHDVRLIPAQHVKPFVRGNKNDANDALAIAEASQRPNLRFVPMKSLEQQDMQALHRIRIRLVRQRTALMNQTRGLLSEYGVVMAKGIPSFRRSLAVLIDPHRTGLTPFIKEQLVEIQAEFIALSERLGRLEKQMRQLADSHPLCKLLSTLPGIGPVNATAIVSAIGKGDQFAHPKDFPVWLGLTPKQFASGEKSSQGRITKRGDRYLRSQLIHGARAVVYNCHRHKDPFRRWVQQLVARVGVNKAAVAVAARLARLSWLMLQRGEVYRVAQA